jgi:hypothetical protein
MMKIDDLRQDEENLALEIVVQVGSIQQALVLR